MWENDEKIDMFNGHVFCSITHHQHINTSHRSHITTSPHHPIIIFVFFFLLHDFPWATRRHGIPCHACHGASTCKALAKQGRKIHVMVIRNCDSPWSIKMYVNIKVLICQWPGPDGRIWIRSTLVLFTTILHAQENSTEWLFTTMSLQPCPAELSKAWLQRPHQIEGTQNRHPSEILAKKSSSILSNLVCHQATSLSIERKVRWEHAVGFWFNLRRRRRVGYQMMCFMIKSD